MIHSFSAAILSAMTLTFKVFLMQLNKLDCIFYL